MKEEKPNRQLKISWMEFMNCAINKIREEYPNAKAPIFMKCNGYEGDSEVYEIPEYVLLNLNQ